MNNSDVMLLTPAILVMGIIELLKWVWRKYIEKNPDYDFPPEFYKVANPVLQVLVIPLMALLMPDQYQMPTDWMEFVRLVVIVAVNAFLTTLVYNGTLAKAKEYARYYRMRYR